MGSWLSGQPRKLDLRGERRGGRDQLSLDFGVFVRTCKLYVERVNFTGCKLYLNYKNRNKRLMVAPFRGTKPGPSSASWLSAVLVVLPRGLESSFTHRRIPLGAATFANSASLGKNKMYSWLKANADPLIPSPTLDTRTRFQTNYLSC